jgi:hypothetical protein
MADPKSEGGRASVRLRALIKEISSFAENASEGQQRILLDFLDDRRLQELLQSAPYADRRKHPRKACSIVAGCSAEGRAFKGLVKNISMGGMFILCIETHRTFSAGERITVALPSPSEDKENIELQGEIVWTVPDGIGVGVKITTGAHDLEDILACL